MKKINLFTILQDRIKEDIKSYCIVVIPHVNVELTNYIDLLSKCFDREFVETKMMESVENDGYGLIAFKSEEKAMIVWNKVKEFYKDEKLGFILFNEIGDVVYTCPENIIQGRTGSEPFKKYIALIYGIGEGCDYTMGCNINFEIVGGESPKQAIDKILDDFSETDFREFDSPEDFEHYREWQIEKIELYEINPSSKYEYEANKILRAEYQALKKKFQDDPEYKEYKRLKGKFEGGT